MVNHPARFFIAFTAVALLDCACSDDSAPAPVVPDAAPDASPGDDDAAAPGREPKRDAGAGDDTTHSPNGEDSTDTTTGAPQHPSSSGPTTLEPSPTSESTTGTSNAPSSTSGDESSAPVDEPTPGNVVFATDQVLDVAITLSPANLTDLEEHGNLEVYLEGEVTISGTGFPTYSATGVGVRHKGSYSLHHCWDEDGVRNYENECAKLSYKLKFDEFLAGQRFDGLKRLNFHASSGDNSKFRELLAYSTFAEFGVDAPRISIARITVNGELQGLFFAVEELDGRYAAAHYPEGPDGNLYKEIWPVLAQTEETYVSALEINDNTPDVSDIQAFASAIDAATPETFEADMAPWVDLDAIVRYLVVDRAIKNWDGIMAFYDPIRPHNFFWYHDSGPNGRFHLIPWDLDNTFWETDPYMTPQEWALNVPPVPDWNFAPANCDPRPVWDLDSGTFVTPPRCDKFLDLLALTQWDRFVELGTEFKDDVLDSPQLRARLDHWQAVLEPFIAEDPTLNREWVEGEQANFRDILDDLAFDFEAYMARGLQDEDLSNVPQLLPEPTEEEFAEVTPPRGIEPGRVTNFEFDFGSDPGTTAPVTEPYSLSTVAYPADAGGPTEVTAVDTDTAAPQSTGQGGETSDSSGPWALPFSDTISSPYSTVSASLNTTAPISGGGDARVEFTHYSSPGAYNEWVNLFLYMNDGIVDVTGYTQIEMTLRADRFRYVRVRVGGAAASDEFGGAWDEFGADFAVDVYPTHITLRLHELVYPTWAKDAWEDGQGWVVSDEVARERFLATMWGLIFVPGADVDEYGELAAATDSGFLEVDDIYFR